MLIFKHVKVAFLRIFPHHFFWQGLRVIVDKNGRYSFHGRVNPVNGDPVTWVWWNLGSLSDFERKRKKREISHKFTGCCIFQQISAAAMTQVSNLLVTLNSSVNLFIYCGFGGKFRRELKNLFCKSFPRRQVNGFFVLVLTLRSDWIELATILWAL